MKITIPLDCDNAPKRRIIKDFIVSVYQKKWHEVGEILDENFSLISFGENSIEVFDVLKEHFSSISKIEELAIHEILSHGKLGACNGKIKLKNQIINFAYFIEFKSAGKNTITKITEYKI